MKRLKTKLFAALLALLMVGALSGIAGAVTLRVAHWWGDEAFQLVWDRFQELNPDIELKLESRPWSGYKDKLLVEMASGTACDVYFLDSSWFGVLFAMGVFEPLDSYAERDNLDLSKFSADPAQEHGYRGKFYGLAQWIPDNPNFWVNKELTNEAGIALPEWGTDAFDTWRWDDLLTAAQKTTKRDASGQIVQWGLGPIANPAWCTIFAWQNGAEIFDDVTALDETRSTLNTPENIEAYQFLVDLVRKHEVMMTPTQAALMAQGAYLSGKVAFTLEWNIYGNMKKADFDWTLIPVPWQTRKVTKYGGNSWTISAGSQNKDAAWRLVKWLTTDIEAQSLMAQYGGLSSYDPDKQVEFAQEEMQKYLFNLLVARTKDVTMRPLWFGSKNPDRVQEIIQNAIDLMFLEGLDVATALRDAENEINSVVYGR